MRTGSKGGGSVRKFTLGLVFVALFFNYSRIFDLALWQLHITMIVYVAALFTVVMQGGIRAFSHRAGLLLLGWCLWMVFCVPLSVWKAGSLATVLPVIQVGLGVYVLFAGVGMAYDDLRRAIHTLAYAVLLLALLTIPFGTISDGRLFPARGRFGNPNDFAQVLLMMLPFWWYMLRTPLASRLRRALAIVAILVFLGMMAHTGSRGGLIGLAVTAIVPFLYATARQRIAMIAATTVVVVAAALFLPERIERRYFILFEADDISSVEDAETAGSAIGSTRGRWELLKDSVELTLAHPLFGVGPGQFPTAQNELAKERGQRRGRWLGTHNSYTQVSSESGIPALICYVGVLIASLRALGRRRLPPAPLRDPVLEDIAQLALALRASIIAYAISTFFSAAAYTTFLPALAGLAVAFERAVAVRLAGYTARPAAAPAFAYPPPRTRARTQAILEPQRRRGRRVGAEKRTNI